MNAGPKLPIPAELASVPQRALRVSVYILLCLFTECAVVVATHCIFCCAAAPAVVTLGLPALQDFLVQYSRLLCDQFAPGVPDSRVRAFVNEVLSDAATGQARPADVVLEFKHVCRSAPLLAARQEEVTNSVNVFEGLHGPNRTSLASVFVLLV